MKRIIAALVLTVIAAALVGCRAKEYSRDYGADMATTWAAALRVVENLTSAAPKVADEDERRIVTEWTHVSDDATQGSAGTLSTRELVRGVIRLTQAESGTKVSIKIDRQSRSLASSPGRGDETGTVGIVLGRSSGGIEELFLDRLSAELEKGDAGDEQPEGEAS